MDKHEGLPIFTLLFGSEFAQSLFLCTLTIPGALLAYCAGNECQKGFASSLSGLVEKQGSLTFLIQEISDSKKILNEES